MKNRGPMESDARGSGAVNEVDRTILGADGEVGEEAGAPPSAMSPPQVVPPPSTLMVSMWLSRIVPSSLTERT